MIAEALLAQPLQASPIVAPEPVSMPDNSEAQGGVVVDSRAGFVGEDDVGGPEWIMGHRCLST